MRVLKFDIKGDYGHFKIPYTNNNPLTHSLLTKTALIGMIGAVIGLDRKDMQDRKLFPLLSEGLKYSVKLNNFLNKVSISLYMVNLESVAKNKDMWKAPKPVEHLMDPHYTVYLLLDTENEDLQEVFDRFKWHIENGYYVWRPTLGIKNCPCSITNIEETTTQQYNGEFATQGFVSKVDGNYEGLIYKDRLPTHQDQNWFNDPEKYVDVYFKDDKSHLQSSGTYYKFKEECLFAI